LTETKKIRVLIADDSLLTRVVLRDILSRDPGIEVAGEVRDGREAVAATLRLQPDLVLMDVIMPVMDGLTAVEEIMASRPTPILVLSANVSPADAQGAFSAIQRGALDVMEKPHGIVQSVFEEIADELIGKVKFLARIKVMHHYRRARMPRSEAAPVEVPQGAYSILAIGASTGGPRAVLQVLKGLPRPVGVSVLIVQHIASGFAEGFARWLAHETGLSVRVARDQEKLAPGVILVAPNDLQMELTGGSLCVFDGPQVNSCRPSVDVLFKSLARGPAQSVAAVLLTGMGRDGAEGMALLRMAGAWTIAQDEKTSIVFGMPKAAIDLGAARQVLGLSEIVQALPRLLVK
jgi:two-component system chemotaxis response regulator CheB